MKSNETLSTTPEAPRSAWAEEVDVPPSGFIIDTNESLPLHEVVTRRIEASIGARALVVAGIRAGDDQFLLVDTHESSQYRTPYILLSGNKESVKGVWPNKMLTIGRQYHTDKFSYSETVSRKHFSLLVGEEDDGIELYDEHSANGTQLTGYYKVPDMLANERFDSHVIHDGFTRNAGEDIARGSDFIEADQTAPYGYFHEYPIIGRKSKSVRGGVYGSLGSEYVVVDEQNGHVQRVIHMAMDDIESLSDTATNHTYAALKKIEKNVAQAMRYDLRAVDELSAPQYDHKGLINLSEYVEKGIGVCRHQAILAALMIEEAHETGLLDGTAGVERNLDLELHGAHAWAVYRDGVNEDIIVDPAQRFVGTRAEARQRKLWRYLVS